MGWLLDALQFLLGYAISGLVWCRDEFFLLASYIWSGFQDLIGQVWAWSLHLLPTSALDILHSTPWTTAWSYLDTVDWIFPIYGCIVIYLAALSACASIRLTRWILGAVPFENL